MKINPKAIYKTVEFGHATKFLGLGNNADFPYTFAVYGEDCIELMQYNEDGQTENGVFNLVEVTDPADIPEGTLVEVKMENRHAWSKRYKYGVGIDHYPIRCVRQGMTPEIASDTYEDVLSHTSCWKFWRFPE